MTVNQVKKGKKVFKPVDSKVNFPEMENDILRFWKEKHVFERSMEQRQSKPQFTMYEGPPTLNGLPGIHHVLARVFKDIFGRYYTMKGYYVPRKAGWDTHGLPVELEVEKKRGMSGKQQIEEYGIEKFNAECRASVEDYLVKWEALTERIGYWTDLKHPYITFDAGYIESCWWLIKQLWDKGLIYLGYKVTPHCPRCETSLSSHEMALGYKDNTPDPSVFIKFKLDLAQAKIKGILGEDVVQSGKAVYLLAWTTTPWTLPGNTALAVAAEAEYTLLEGESDYLIFAMERVVKVKPEGYSSRKILHGSELVGLKYSPLFNPHEFGISRYYFCSSIKGNEENVSGQSMLEIRPEDKDLRYPVIATDFVTMEEGTGIVHVAPAFGEVDFIAGMDLALDFVQPVSSQGKMLGNYSFAGKFVKDADPLIIKELTERGLLYRSERIRHTYPFCWRCNSPLLYYAKQTWYIRTTAAKEALIAANEEINWYPEHIKNGRFGDWLEHNVDWAFSRERYWGTPLPVWRCDHDASHMECIGSVAELKTKAGLEGLQEPLEPHRPFVDYVTFNCAQCGGKMHRVPEVIDCWFDSGSMPIAQWHYPFENKEIFQKSFPADYICEAVDQTRGWFYSLHVLATLLFGKTSFKNVICLGHILDAQGEKMSKSRGNVVEPWTILDSQGADALRWYLYTSSPPGNVRRFSAGLVSEVLRKTLITLWNTYSFFVTYAEIDKFNPLKAEQGHRSELDRWILSELNQLIIDVRDNLDNYDPTGAGRKIEEFIDELSNWYVRRSRRRFWKSENDSDKMAAYHTLYRCLEILSLLMAPFTPFIAEEMYQNLARSPDVEIPESVHLCDFPEANNKEIDRKLSADIRAVIRVCSLGRAARSKANIKVRQPLEKIMVKVGTAVEQESLQRLSAQVMEELNVKRIEFVADEGALVDFQVKPNLVLLGPKYGKELGSITRALKEMEPGQVVRETRAGRAVTLGGHTIEAEEIMVETSDREGMVAVVGGGYVVAIETKISPELQREGVAREIVHRLQTMRRDAGFDIANYITTFYQADESIQQVMQEFADYIRQETLSRQLINSVPEDGAYIETQEIEGKEIVFGVKRIK